MTLVKEYFVKALRHIDWMFNTMDLTQWALVSIVMVILGFIAIKCR